MALPQVDNQTAALVRAALARATRDGIDPVRALDREGLVAHPARRLQERRELILKVASALDEATMAQLAGTGVRIPGNALDTRRMIVAWLRAMATAPAKE